MLCFRKLQLNLYKAWLLKFYYWLSYYFIYEWWARDRKKVLDKQNAKKSVIFGTIVYSILNSMTQIVNDKQVHEHMTPRSTACVKEEELNFPPSVHCWMYFKKTTHPFPIGNQWIFKEQQNLKHQYLFVFINFSHY